MWVSIIYSLQVEQKILQFFWWFLVETLSHEESQFVRVLAWSRDSNCPRPVVVEVSQLVCQALDVVWPQTRGVLDHVVAGGVHGALPHGLGDQEEIIPDITNHCKMYLKTRNTTFQAELPRRPPRSHWEGWMACRSTWRSWCDPLGVHHRIPEALSSCSTT